MNDVVVRLRIDAGRLTLAALIQERETAACEIERLQHEIALLRGTKKVSRTTPLSGAQAIDRDSRLDPAGAGSATRIFLRLSEVCQTLAIGRSTIYKWISEGTFPAPLRISSRTVRWRSEDVEAWRSAIEHQRAP